MLHLNGELNLIVLQGWSQQLVDADKAYTAFFTGCALAGPDACPFASSDIASPLDVHVNILALLQSAYDAFRANESSVPVTSGQLRGRFHVSMIVDMCDRADDTILTQLCCGRRCTVRPHGRTLSTTHSPL